MENAAPTMNHRSAVDEMALAKMYETYRQRIGFQFRMTVSVIDQTHDQKMSEILFGLIRISL